MGYRPFSHVLTPKTEKRAILWDLGSFSPSWPQRRRRGWGSGPYVFSRACQAGRRGEAWARVLMPSRFWSRAATAKRGFKPDCRAGPVLGWSANDPGITLQSLTGDRYGCQPLFQGVRVQASTRALRLSTPGVCPYAQTQKRRSQPGNGVSVGPNGLEPSTSTMST